jgi:hypothetical protein
MKNLTVKISQKYENRVFQKEQVSCERKNICIMQCKSTRKNTGAWIREGKSENRVKSDLVCTLFNIVTPIYRG